MTSEAQDRLGRRVAEVRNELADLSSEVEGLHERLRGPGAGRPTTRATPDRANGSAPASAAAPNAAEVAEREPPQEASAGDQSPENAGSEAEGDGDTAQATPASESHAELIASLGERVRPQSDLQLAETFDRASSFLADAEARDDRTAAAYWRAFVTAVLEETGRRPELGKDRGGVLGRRRRQRLVGRLQDASRASAREQGSAERQ